MKPIELIQKLPKTRWHLRLFFVVLLVLSPQLAYTESATDETSSMLTAARNPELASVRIPAFSLIPKVGYTFLYRTRQGDHTTPDRHGFSVGALFGIGKYSYQFSIEPLVTFETTLQQEPYYFVGTNLGLNYVWHRSVWVPSVGLGLRGGYLNGPASDRGAEIYGRFLASINWIVSPSLAFYLEMVALYGITGVKTPTMDYFTWGSGFGVESAMGVRFW